MKDINKAYAIVHDNMNAVRAYVDSAPFVDLPGEDERVEFSVLTRFSVLREITRKFVPEKFNVISRLERLTKRLQQKAISSNAFFSEVKHIALQNDVSPTFIEKVERQLFNSKKMAIKPFNFQNNFQQKGRWFGKKNVMQPKPISLPKFRFQNRRGQ